MTQDDKKKAVALAALEYVESGSILGIGTGSTVNHFVEALESIKHKVVGAVASSEASADRLSRVGIPPFDLNEVGSLTLCFDGADEATRRRQLIKGGGGALAREKIVAAASERFICLIDDSKLVGRLGGMPLPVEVIPMARRLVARQIEQHGGRPVHREGFITDNGNEILDVHDLSIVEPQELEDALNQIAGVVANGLFCRRPADLLLVGADDGVRVID
jgi:ribose 5-phosphate isomerase A